MLTFNVDHINYSERYCNSREVLCRWERLDDMVVLPAEAFRNEIWSSLGEELWAIVARSLNVQRVARQVRFCYLCKFVFPPIIFSLVRVYGVRCWHV